MVANVDNIKATFIKCNNDYFGGELPLPHFKLLHSFRTCGYFQYTKEDWFDKTLHNPTLFITDYYEFTQKQFVDVMCHEMVHYYLAHFGLDRNCNHGKQFKKMAERLNKTYSLNITKTVDLSKLKRRKGTPSLLYWFAMHF